MGKNDSPLGVVGQGEKPQSSHSGSQRMGSLYAIPDARNVLLLLSHEWFNEAGLPAWIRLDKQTYLSRAADFVCKMEYSVQHIVYCVVCTTSYI